MQGRFAITGTPVSFCIGASVDRIGWSVITMDRVAIAAGLLLSDLTGERAGNPASAMLGKPRRQPADAF
jgi:hypothetical protein